MRTWFAPDKAEEFEAAKDLLIRRCVTWAEEHGHPVDDLLGNLNGPSTSGTRAAARVSEDRGRVR
ncbi:hypothetical protein GCM10020220_041430 [Nonomuraea rubra]